MIFPKLQTLFIMVNETDDAKESIQLIYLHKFKGIKSNFIIRSYRDKATKILNNFCEIRLTFERYYRFTFIA